MEKGSLSGRGPLHLVQPKPESVSWLIVNYLPPCVNVHNVTSRRVINRPEPGRKMMMLICYHALTLFWANTRTSAWLIWFSLTLVNYLYQCCHLKSFRPTSKVTKAEGSIKTRHYWFLSTPTTRYCTIPRFSRGIYIDAHRISFIHLWASDWNKNSYPYQRSIIRLAWVSRIAGRTTSCMCANLFR